MADEEIDEEEVPKKASKFPLIIGLVLAIAGGGGGFFAVQSGMILGGEAVEEPEDEPEVKAGALPDITFVEVEPLVISLGAEARNKYLRFRAQLEVVDGYEADVTKLLPRVVDVLNSYLRAVETAQLEDPSALIRLRAQMLRRVQIVTGEGRVRDLLITEFVLN
ncbi:flagellar basal body-associated protein FliL [Roseobacter sp.]|uniref:flagellar basal body-associated FliL family protein n=1 Tax=Roseobacter sp. TaxID=1907202 RepID=UPI003859758B